MSCESYFHVNLLGADILSTMANVFNI